MPTPERVRPGPVQRMMQDGAWTLLAQVGSKGFVAATIAINGIILGVEGLGRFAALQGAAILASVAVDCGLSACVIRELAGGVVLTADGRGRFLFQRVFLTFLGILLACVLGGWGAHGMRTSEYLPLIALVLSLFGSGIIQAINFSRLNFKRASIANGGIHLVGAGFLALLFLSPLRNVASALWLQFVVESFTVLALIRVLPPVHVDQKDLKRSTGYDSLSFRSSLPYASTAAMNVAINRSDAVLVGALAGSTVVGLFSPASQAQNAVTGVGLALSAGLMTHSAATLRNQDFSRARTLLGPALRWTTRVTAVMALVGLGALPAIRFVPALHGFEDSAIPLVTFLVLSPFSVRASVYMYFLAGIGLAKKVTQSWILATALTLVAHLVLTTRFGLIGATASAVLRDFVLVGASWYFVRIATKQNESLLGLGKTA